MKFALSRWCALILPLLVANPIYAGVSNSELTNLATQLNKKMGFPIMVDRVTRADPVYVDGSGAFTYPYTLIGISPSPNDFDQQIAPSVRTGACKNANSIFMLKKDVVLAYRYSQTDGRHLGTVRVTRRDCGF